MPRPRHFDILATFAYATFFAVVGPSWAGLNFARTFRT